MSTRNDNMKPFLDRDYQFMDDLTLDKLKKIISDVMLKEEDSKNMELIVYVAEDGELKDFRETREFDRMMKEELNRQTKQE